MPNACERPSPKWCSSRCKAGIDIVDDGEYGKNISWSQYALERLSGFERRPVALDANPFNAGADRSAVPGILRRTGCTSRAPHRTGIRSASGPITYTGAAAIQRDIEDLKAALKGEDVTEAFFPSPRPQASFPTARTNITE